MEISRRGFAAASFAALSGAAMPPGAAFASDGHDAPSGGGGAPADGITVAEHFVPMPDKISPEAQAFLRATSPFGDATIPDWPGDAAAWAAYRAKADAGILFMTKGRAEAYPAKLVTHRLSASKLYDITPDNLDSSNQGRAILYIHGGGFMIGGGDAARYSAQQIAGESRARVYATDYRLAPEHPFPQGLEDVVEAYRFMLRGHKPGNVAFFGGSAGANLVAAAVLKARDEGLPLPAAAAMHSVPSDMTGNGDSEYTNVQVDTILRRRDQRIAANYAGGHDPKDPLLSPVYGDYSQGFVPCILTSGTRDILLSGTVRLHRALVRAGVEAQLHVWEAMPHAPFLGSPEETEVYAAHIDFMLRHMGRAG